VCGWPDIWRAGLSYLSGCGRLESLDISYCSAISDVGVLSLLPASLHTLTLRNLFENNLPKDGSAQSTTAEGVGLKGGQKITHSITAEVSRDRESGLVLLVLLLPLQANDCSSSAAFAACRRSKFSARGSTWW
jgi:hypothetical protein